MKARHLVTALACSTLVPLVSMNASLAPPVAAAPVVALQAPAAGAPATPALPIASTRLERHDAARGLGQAAAAATASTPGPAWLAWSVPAVSQGRGGDWQPPHDDGCVLDDDGRIRNGHGTTGSTTTLVILARIMAREIDRVTLVDARCTVQAGTRIVHWFDGVRPADSVSVLAPIAERFEAEPHDRRQAALAAIALTDDASADAALGRFVAPGKPGELRKQAAFWLGAARGAAGAAVVDRLATTETDTALREHLTFVLTLTGPSGLDRLIDLARHDPDAQVRRQAIFWLSQKAGERAAGTIAAAVDEDPELEVRKHAVFAMSQLPKDEGVPKLIALARTHKDREVRKQAMFWLGQSGDPRALALFEDVLK